MKANAIDTFDVFECYYQSQLTSRVRMIKFYLEYTGADLSDPVNFNLLYNEKAPKYEPLHQDDTESTLDIQEYYLRQAVFNTDKVERVYSHTEGKLGQANKWMHMGGKHNPMDYLLTTNKFLKFLDECAAEKQRKNMLFRNPLPTQKNKVCFWGWREHDVTATRYGRTLNGKSPHRKHKSDLYTEAEWDILYEYLKSRYNVVELYLRMPIREVFYHLRTCEFSIGTSGGYHNTAAGLGKPQISLGNWRVRSFDFMCQNEYHPVGTKIDQITTDSFFDECLEIARSKQL